MGSSGVVCMLRKDPPRHSQFSHLCPEVTLTIDFWSLTPLLSPDSENHLPGKLCVAKFSEAWDKTKTEAFPRNQGKYSAPHKTNICLNMAVENRKQKRRGGWAQCPGFAACAMLPGGPSASGIHQCHMLETTQTTCPVACPCFHWKAVSETFTWLRRNELLFSKLCS